MSMAKWVVLMLKCVHYFLLGRDKCNTCLILLQVLGHQCEKSRIAYHHVGWDMSFALSPVFWPDANVAFSNELFVYETFLQISKCNVFYVHRSGQEALLRQNLPSKVSKRRVWPEPWPAVCAFCCSTANHFHEPVLFCLKRFLCSRNRDKPYSSHKN